MAAKNIYLVAKVKIEGGHRRKTKIANVKKLILKMFGLKKTCAGKTAV